MNLNQDADTCWGHKTVQINIAHCISRLSGLSPYQQEALETRYATFLAHGKPATARCSVLPDHTPAREPERFVSPTGEYAMELTHSADDLAVTGYNFRAVLTMEPDFHGRLWVHDEIDLAQNMVTENYLRIVTAYAALSQGGLLLHSAGIVLDGKAHLFLGRSGAGKTTLSRLALGAGKRVLSDDINVIIPDDGGYFAVSVPFAGELETVAGAAGDRFPVGGLHFIEKGTPLRYETLSAGQCLAIVLVCSPFVNEDPFRLDRVMSIAADLTGRCPGGALRLGKGDSFTSIENLLREYCHDKS